MRLCEQHLGCEPVSVLEILISTRGNRQHTQELARRCEQITTELSSREKTEEPAQRFRRPYSAAAQAREKRPQHSGERMIIKSQHRARSRGDDAGGDQRAALHRKMALLGLQSRIHAHDATCTVLFRLTLRSMQKIAWKERVLFAHPDQHRTIVVAGRARSRELERVEQNLLLRDPMIRWNEQHAR